jgi:hypothetical protein
MPSSDRKLELKAKTSVAQTGSQPFVYVKGLNQNCSKYRDRNSAVEKYCELYEERPGHKSERVVDTT